MGASLGDLNLSACSTVKHSVKAKLRRRGAKTTDPDDPKNARLRSTEKAREDQAAAVQAALKAVQQHQKSNPQRGKQDESSAPEVSSLPERGAVVVAGRMSDTIELPFQDKGMAMKGCASLEELIDVHLAAVRCRNGRICTFLRPNQDDFFYVQTTDSFRVLGVFDGHGGDGHAVAAAARDFLLRKLLSDMPKERPRRGEEGSGQMQAMLVDAFEEAHRHVTSLPHVDASLSGATVCILVQDIKRRWLTVAWVGDCRCALAEKREVMTDQMKDFGDAKFVRRKNLKLEKKPFMHHLTQDHSVERNDERARVKAAGAHFRPSKTGPHEIVAPGESWPGIPVTRCLGNLVGHRYGVIHVPEVVELPSAEPGRESEFVMLGTDAVWSVMKDHEVQATMKDCLEDNLVYGLDQILRKALSRWEQKGGISKIVDDMTLMVMRL